MSRSAHPPHRAPDARPSADRTVQTGVSRVGLVALAASVLPGVAVQSAALAQSASNPRVATAEAAAVPRSRYLTTSDGARLHLLESAARASPAPAPVIVLLIPGWSMPATIWRRQMALPGAGVAAVVALDPRGQGQSDVPDGGFNIDRRADDLHEVVSHLLVQAESAKPRLVLVGWSLGALEALHYLRRHGEAEIAGLVLVDSSIGEGPAPAKPDADAASAIGLSFADELRRDRRAALKNFMRAIFRRPPPQAELDALTQAALRLPLEASLALFPSTLPREHWQSATRSFTKPLLYAVTPQFAAQAASLRRHRPATQVELFPQAGHALFADEPGRFNRMLAAFIAALPAP